MPLLEVPIGPRSPERFEPLIGPDLMAQFMEQARELRSRLAGRVIWNLNSTSAGGGVAELLHSLVAYARGVGFDSRWVVVQGPPEFFLVTKRLHHALHGADGDRTPLDATAAKLFSKVLRDNAAELMALIRAGDVVIAHDPQTAGLIPHLTRTGAHVVWRCHIGADRPNDQTEEGWRFLAPHLGTAHACVFSRQAFIPEGWYEGRTEVIHPTIDPFSPKNQELDPEVTRAILVHTGIIEGPLGTAGREFTREDGSPGRVDRSADVIHLGPAPSWKTPLVVQVSRWDSLKDPVGVLRGFASIVDGRAPGGAELVLAGPDVHAVSDDPEGPEVFEEVVAAWRDLPHAAQRRVHLVNLPMTDTEENGAIVNALQRHAAVVVQKSLREGFGLTVAEAMWKGRPVVASAIGGIQDQIEDEKSGLLVEDPEDLDAFGHAVTRLLENPELSSTLGQAARERVRERFLGIRSLERWGALITRILESES